MANPSNEQLMTAVLAGARPALAALVERYHGPLLAYLYRLTGGDRPLAEDLVQDTFVRLLRPSGYHPGRPFKPWLYAIATNRARDHFKAAAVRYHAGPPQARDVVDETAGPAEQLHQELMSHCSRLRWGGVPAASRSRTFPRTHV